MTFEVFENGQCVFSSNKHWLHPIFDFEEFLQTWPGERQSLLVRDKIIGRAAALLLIHLGIRRIHAGTISLLAIRALEHYRVPFTFDLQIDRIACQTENILSETLDSGQAWEIIRQRIATSGAGIK